MQTRVKSFRDLQNYTTLKQELIYIHTRIRFRDLQNYTTLKRMNKANTGQYSFRDLQNYTTLKPQIIFEAQE